MRRSATRRVVFAFAAAATAFVAAVALFFAVDLFLHQRAERSAGVNPWGYRGPIAPRKRPNDARVLVLGGSTVFGYGLTWNEAFPAQLERRLNARAGDRPYSVVNLGYNNEGAYSFRFTLADYAYLQPDVVCLYEGYNDLMGDAYGGNPAVFRHTSPLFRATGYFPILPLVLREKAMSLRSGGDLDAAYTGDEKTVFTPNLARRATSEALSAAASISESLERQIVRLGGERPSRVMVPPTGGCAFPWQMYCRDVAAAIDYASSRGWRVVFVSQPYLTTDHARDRHIAQQRAVAAMLRQRYARHENVRYVDLGTAIDLRDATVAFDGMHLTAAGNARVAELLTVPIAEAARAGVAAASIQ
jgi:lysophospholipase L1-like esterase